MNKNKIGDSKLITVRELISNISKGQSSLGIKYILAGLDQYYDSIKNDMKITHVKPHLDGVMIFFKVPSKSKQGKYYDVVIWADTTDKVKLETKIQVYSNSPAFAYNFAYVFYQQNSLLYADKYPQDFKTVPARVRNPFGLFGFDKHVYSCLKSINKINLPRLAIKYEDGPEPDVSSFQDKRTEMR